MTPSCACVGRVFACQRFACRALAILQSVICQTGKGGESCCRHVRNRGWQVVPRRETGEGGPGV
eukprot:11190216-Lingulodinium_polyedra.AAC.1